MQTYEEAVKLIDHIGKSSTHPGVENSEKLLAALGHPEQGAKIIHVAGTNGKGSVCAFLADMLTAQGFRTGLFISPHLVDIRERIQLDREMIGKEDFAACFFLVHAAVEELMQNGYTGITYFDYLLAIALCWYRQQGVDYIILETGLGGRLDSTNAIAHPLLTIITSISLDHTEILGDTLAKIAAEKAGIIKRGVPLIYCTDETEACEVITKRAHDMAAPCIGVGRGNCTYSPANDAPLPAHQFSFTFHLHANKCAPLWENHETDCSAEEKQLLRALFADGIRERLTVNSPALYQAENAAIAYMAAVWVNLQDGGKMAHTIPSGITLLNLYTSLRATLQHALAHSVWEGRFEEVLPDVYLDGAHNADGIRMLLASLPAVAKGRPVTLLFSAVKEKDTMGMIREICESGLFHRYLVTTVGGARAVAPEELKEHFLAYTNFPVTAYASPQEAFGAALKLKGDDILLCAGSLYLVGSIKERLGLAFVP